MVYKKINVRVNKHEEIPNVIRSLVENNSLFSILTDYTNYSLYRALCKLLLLLLLLLIQFFYSNGHFLYIRKNSTDSED